MIFGDVRFFAIVAGCWLSFFAVPAKGRSAVLACWGVLFYAVYAWQFLPLLLIITGAAFAAGGGRPGWAVVGAVALLLAGFKSGGELTRWLAIGPLPPGASAVIPLGFSFLAFELMHFAIERRRGRIPPASLSNVLAFAFFFPCRVAGPIKRYPAFATAVAQAEASVDNVYAGVARMAIGFFKKFVVADLLALTVGEAGYAATRMQVWKVVFAFGLQLYFDFSAYSDIAIGVSRVLGIAVPENFRSPYLSANIRDFWTRWHITLSWWVRDYVFMPVGRALFRTRLRGFPGLIATVSYLSAFVVVGAWHGLAANFLVWGLYHGMLLSVHHLYRARMPAALYGSRLWRSHAVTAGATLVTFFLVTIGWVPFMTDLPKAMTMLRIMFMGA